MLPPTNERVEIVKYYMFHDVPRLILAKDGSGRFWILDCPSDDQLDDYSSYFSVVFAGTDPEKALATLEGTENCPAGMPVAMIPVADVQFDLTKRKASTLLHAS